MDGEVWSFSLEEGFSTNGGKITIVFALDLEDMGVG